MDEKSFLDSLEKLLASNFEVARNVKIENIECDLFAKYFDSKVRTFITAQDVIDKYENFEYFVVQFFPEPDLQKVEAFMKDVEKYLQMNTSPNEYHMSTKFNVILVFKRGTEQIIHFVKNYRFRKVYKFYLHGWSEIKLVVIFSDENKIYHNKDAKDLRKLIEKNLTLFWESTMNNSDY